jgi:hypothetical protein
MIVGLNAGYVIEEESGDLTLLSNGKLKSNWEDGGIIMDGSKDIMILFFSQKKVYARGTTDDYCKEIKAMYDLMMKNIPEEQRKMMEQMMGKKPKETPPKVSVVKTGSGEIIAGFKTVKYKVLVNGKLYKEIWLATDPSLINEYKPIVRMMWKFGSCTGSMQKENSPETSPEYLALMEKGLELKSISYDEDDTEENTDIVNIQKKDIPANAFKVPAGYKKVSFSELIHSGAVGE